jgi:hypothetical protein
LRDIVPSANLSLIGHGFLLESGVDWFDSRRKRWQCGRCLGSVDQHLQTAAGCEVGRDVEPLGKQQGSVGRAGDRMVVT